MIVVIAAITIITISVVMAATILEDTGFVRNFKVGGRIFISVPEVPFIPKSGCYMFPLTHVCAGSRRRVVLGLLPNDSGGGSRLVLVPAWLAAARLVRGWLPAGYWFQGVPFFSRLVPARFQ